MDVRQLITIDKAVLSGTPVFTGTRVPIETLFDHLEAGRSLDELFSDFPTVKRQRAIDLFDAANKIMTSDKLEQLYASVA